MRWPILKCSGLALFLLTACGGGSTARVEPVYDFSATDQAVEGFLAETPSLAGAGLIVVHREWGVLHHRAFGAFALDRISLVASASKMVSAGILNRLADDGLLDLDEPIREVLGWEGAYPEVTTAHLLSNSSGLVGLFPDLTFAPYRCQLSYEGTLLDCGKSIFTSRPAATAVVPPETEFRYGGGQWQVAGAVAEAVSGKTWDMLFQEIYREPCGLASSGYNNQWSQFPDTGLLEYPGAFASDPESLLPTENPNPEGGLFTTTGDYGKLLLMQLRGGRCDEQFVMSPESVRRMQANQILGTGEGVTNSVWPGYGYGWWVDTEREGWVTDPGAYGAVPWLDLMRGYGVMIILEGNAIQGSLILEATLATIEEAIDNPGL